MTITPSVVYPQGYALITVPASGSIGVFTSGDDSAKVSKQVGFPNHPDVWQFLSNVSNEKTVFGPYTDETVIKIEAGADLVYYSTNVAEIDGYVVARQTKLGYQDAPVTKTVSATLTALELINGIILVNQGAAGASALQLPTASSLEGYITLQNTNSFDFSVINTSTVDAEDASITTNTGWTLVGPMDLPAYSASGITSAGRFRAVRTNVDTWTLYRLS